MGRTKRCVRKSQDYENHAIVKKQPQACGPQIDDCLHRKCQYSQRNYHMWLLCQQPTAQSREIRASLAHQPVLQMPKIWTQVHAVQTEREMQKVWERGPQNRWM